MKKIHSLFTLTLFFIISSFAIETSASEKESSLMVVSFHADWCGSCKIIEPNLVKARGKADLDNKNVLFVTLDQTDATKRNQSKLLANAIGVNNLYSDNKGKTGFILLVNSSNGEEIGKITKADDASSIISKINEGVKSL